MALYITWTDTNNAEDGYNVYVRDTPMTWPSDVPTPVFTNPDTVEYTADVDETVDQYVIVTALKGAAEVAGQEFHFAPGSGGGGGDDFTNAQVGDEIGGGIYAGTITYADAREFHLVFGKQGSEATGLQWGNYGTTTGAADPDDGKANQDLILASFDNGDSDAFYHCRDYVDGAGNDDYYMPAKNELAKVDVLLDMSHAEFSTALSEYRWASTEDSSSFSQVRRFSDGNAISTSKNGNDFANLRVRPVRRVAV
ncbi:MULTISPECIES: hypothetical protein [Halomonas]|uniref:DUF1566 domain-containing protein n=1 Tax=Halomonas halophila TaxID=29573 RepID=A0ABQ0U1P3_9GAMM|nr:MULTISPECIES: hypothetical protein [Halomonas]MDR5889623.1 hypothetical protein [Halomonas salina]WJY06305.1 hypothetical protein QWG60_11365 [Halomonas halophila]GEK71608.1 hypothetical protein HHA04nite_01520 [Halomonas halophila]